MAVGKQRQETTRNRASRPPRPARVRELPEEIRVHRPVGSPDWLITQRDQSDEPFRTLEEAVNRAVVIFRRRRTVQLTVQPPARW